NSLLFMSSNASEDFKLETAEATGNLGECTSSAASILFNEGIQLSGVSDTCIPAPSENGENNCIQLHEELDSLKKILAENEATIELQNSEMQNLWINWCIVCKQNQELVEDNAQLLKELTTDREKSKLLMHEYKQMSAMYKVKVMELEETVAKLLQQLEDVQETTTKDFVEKSTHHGEPKHKFGQCNSSSGHTSGNSKVVESCLKRTQSLNEENTNYRRSCLTRLSDNVSCKEPSLIRKSSREEQTVSCPQMPSKSHYQLVGLDQNESVGSVCFCNGAGVSDKVYNNVTMDVTCPQQSKTIAEDVLPSKDSTKYLDNSYICTREVDQRLEIKQQQQQPPPPPPQQQKLQQQQRQQKQQQQQQLLQEEEEETEQAIPCKETLSPLPKDIQAIRRSSIGSGRPTRKAKDTVASYKEIPLKTKLRRS
ncbi:hypothetical protein KI387_033233, partial [Taxus chinensis]